MENAEEILQCLDEFAKLKPKDIPRELEDYLCFVAKTGDPVYQWPLIKCLFREKLLSVITDFYESCPSIEIPPCPNVDTFNYDAMKNFILEKLDTFAAAPFTVQRICELLTSPRKEYNRIDKYMRALEKNILVVSTKEPGNRKSSENGESVVNGIESEHVSQEMISSDINVEVEMDETASIVPYANMILESQTPQHSTESVQDTYVSESKDNDTATCSSSMETVITSRSISYISGYTPNITDLIVEPSTESETPQAPVENTEPQPVTTANGTIDVFAPDSHKEESEPVFVKADCSESSFSPVEPSSSLVQIEPLVQESELEQIPPPTQAEPESSTAAQTEPESSLTYPTSENDSEQIETEPQNETAITSSDEMPNSSEQLQRAPTPPPVMDIAATTDDQVTESNIESEYIVSQTNEPVIETEAEPETETEPESEPTIAQNDEVLATTNDTNLAAVNSEEENMQVDQVTTDVTENSTVDAN